MRIGIVGAGPIGANCARQFVASGHEVNISYSRDADRLRALAETLGPTAAARTPARAVRDADVVILSVPWTQIDEVLAEVGTLEDRIVIDTTNQFGRHGVIDLNGRTAARLNADRMPGARYTKSFNALTAGFQSATAFRAYDEQTVQWVAGDDLEAKGVVVGLIEEAGYAGIDLAGIDTCRVMEAPRRPNAVYGEEYRRRDAKTVVDALAAGTSIPSRPTYD